MVAVGLGSLAIGIHSFRDPVGHLNRAFGHRRAVPFTAEDDVEVALVRLVGAGFALFGPVAIGFGLLFVLA